MQPCKITNKEKEWKPLPSNNQTLWWHCKQPKQQSTYLCKQSGCQTSWCPPWVLAHPHPGRITKTTISHGGKEINKNRNQSTYNAATGSWCPNAKNYNIADTASYYCKKKKQSQRKMVRQRKREQLTCVMATCTSGVLMPVPWCYLWCCLLFPLAASWCAANIASYYRDTAATSWCQDATSCAEEEENIEKKGEAKRRKLKQQQTCAKKICLCYHCHPVQATTINNQPVGNVSRREAPRGKVLLA